MNLLSINKQQNQLLYLKKNLNNRFHSNNPNLLLRSKSQLQHRILHNNHYLNKTNNRNQSQQKGKVGFFLKRSLISHNLTRQQQINKDQTLQIIYKHLLLQFLLQIQPTKPAEEPSPVRTTSTVEQPQTQQTQPKKGGGIFGFIKK
ncbi:hypothetical protein FGO68_gene9568 [Halteria grandinella]|uniref:Uncharacterized protein n=1 Tax=Halteria grandinella TaxID=5974 RepID=A0A8J8NAV9_HALGN|nr:hypothetical protein FGO68_gene9568 [Halteria grandinella]